MSCLETLGTKEVPRGGVEEMFSVDVGGLALELLEGDDAMIFLFSSAIIPAQLNSFCAVQCSVSSLVSSIAAPLLGQQ